MGTFWANPFLSLSLSFSIEISLSFLTSPRFLEEEGLTPVAAGKLAWPGCKVRFSLMVL